MQRLETFSFYRAGYNLHRLTEVQADAQLAEWIHVFVVACDWLDRLLSNELVSLTTSRHSCTVLREELKQLIPSSDREIEETHLLKFRLAYLVPKLAKELEIALGADLQSLNTYFIKKKGIYSTPDLIERADQILPEHVRNAIPCDCTIGSD